MPIADTIDPDGAKCGICLYISDDWRTWHFQSTDDPEAHHTVDLAEWELSGACSCPDFDIKIRPLLRDKVIRPHSDRAFCKHIRRANKILNYKTKKHLFLKTNPDSEPDNPNQLT